MKVDWQDVEELAREICGINDESSVEDNLAKTDAEVLAMKLRERSQQASLRIQASRSGVAVCVPTSKNHFAASPNSLIWSIVCPAPLSRNSGGRSVVRTSSGTRASCASITAGR